MEENNTDKDISSQKEPSSHENKEKNILPDTGSVLSDVEIFLQRLHSDIPEVFEKQHKYTFLYKGEICSIHTHNVPDDATQSKVNFIDNILHITPYQQNPNEIFLNWIKAEATKYILSHVHTRAVEMGVNYNDIRIKDQKSLWGSCSSKGNLNFSYRLIKMPFKVMDYLVVHELAHLIHLNHSQEYWNIVAKWCPDYKRHRKWLNDNKDFLFKEIKIK